MQNLMPVLNLAAEKRINLEKHGFPRRNIREILKALKRKDLRVIANQ